MHLRKTYTEASVQRDVGVRPIVPLRLIVVRRGSCFTCEKGTQHFIAVVGVRKVNSWSQLMQGSGAVLVGQEWAQAHHLHVLFRLLSRYLWQEADAQPRFWILFLHFTYYTGNNPVCCLDISGKRRMPSPILDLVSAVWDSSIAKGVGSVPRHLTGLIDAERACKSR